MDPQIPQQSQPQSAPNMPQEPVIIQAEQSSNKPIFVIIILLLLITLIGAGIYFVVTQKSQTITKLQKQISGNKQEIALRPSPVTDEFAGWKTYKNTKYNYEIQLPNDYAVGYANVPAGQFEKANGNESQLDIQASLSGEDEFNNILQIQVGDKDFYNKSLLELAQTTYEQQKNNSPSKISNLEQSQFNQIADYEYTFTGKAISTPIWSGVMKNGEYKVIMLENKGLLFSFYLKNSDIFNKILSTFKFTEQKQEVSNKNTFKSETCGFTINYPSGWKVANSSSDQACLNLYAPDYKENEESYAGFLVYVGRIKLGTPSVNGQVTAYNSIDDYITDNKELIENISRNKTYGNVTGVQFTENAFLTMQQFMFLHGNYIYIVSWKDSSNYDGVYEPEVNTIISSIQF